jgi:hypothetical protein
MNWGTAKAKVKSIVANNGETLEHLVLTTSGSDRYSTGSSTTYGYGDETLYYTTGSLIGIPEPIREGEITIEPGFSQDCYLRFYIDPDSTVSYLDLLVYPSGSGIKYMILPSKTWRANSITVSQILMTRRLIPKSGSLN